MIALRVEFLKARGRVRRFDEEINILKEEKRRTVVTLEHEALTWDQRQGMRFLHSEALSEGLAAYAARQASLRRGLKAKFITLWTAQPRDPDACPRIVPLQPASNPSAPGPLSSSSSISPSSPLDSPSTATGAVNATPVPLASTPSGTPVPIGATTADTTGDSLDFSLLPFDPAQATSVTATVADILRGVALHDSDDSDVDILARDDYSDDDT